MADRAAELAVFRNQLEALLASKDFASSRHLSDFLRFVSERAFEGTVQLEQEEIAAHVLGKDRKFVATYDSSVRKLASMTRQRLGRYYEREGVSDPVVVSLPLRSYLPVYRVRDLPAERDAQVPKPAARWKAWRWIAALMIAGAAAAAAIWNGTNLAESARPREYVIETARGDFSFRGSDAAPGNVLVGGPLEDGQELTALLDFRPEFEAQQAGILVWQDADNYVRLGRRFTGRNHFELAAEWREDNKTPPENIVFDPEGQTGRPVWLSLRRAGQRFTGAISYDASTWHTIGSPLELPGNLTKAVAGIYAFHGRREAPVARAVFRHVSTGHTFANIVDVDWNQKVRASCGGEAQAIQWPPRLSIRLLTRDPGCSAIVPTGRLENRAWAVETRIDSVNIPGAMSGLFVAGTLGRVRLLRYDMNGPSIVIMNDNRMVYSEPDFRGSPPVSLRLERSGDSILAGYSRDSEAFTYFKHRIAISDLGAELSSGLILSTTTKAETPFAPSMGAYYFRRDVLNLRPYR